MQFVIDEHVDAVLSSERFDNFVLVLPNPLDEVARDTDVERAVALAGEDVHGRLFHVVSLDSRTSRRPRGGGDLDSRLRGNDREAHGNDGHSIPSNSFRPFSISSSSFASRFKITFGASCSTASYATSL
jgi:hypothetical protein